MSILALPIDMPYTYWYGTLRQDLPTFDIPDARDEKNWVEDANYLLRNEECTKLNCPWPSTFTNWRNWAQQWTLAFGGQV